ncbi:MAG: hypothetical protein RBG13Loki_0803 [Promethearchaeota archaeon CR_4]|nr:MAG: hypothetical protein RBG13Loki_0803 [Candidatus Lokiarchaeota archaeon CR_4]
MPWWECSKCFYTFQGEAVPNECPHCKKTCTFNNVTCYVPDCGECGSGKEHIDVRLIHMHALGKTAKDQKKK